MIQEELDQFEKAILTELFGGYTKEHLVLHKGIFKWDLSDKVQEYIDKLESVLKPLMDERGYIQSARLKQFIDIPYIVIPEGKFRPVELLPYIKKFIPNIRGLLQ